MSLQAIALAATVQIGLLPGAQLIAHRGAPASIAAPRAHADSSLVIRVNQMGYLPGDRKVAVACATAPVTLSHFTLTDSSGKIVFGPAAAHASGSFGPCTETFRLDFTAFRRPGRYVITADRAASVPIRIDAHAYDGAADTLLYYMREQRSGFNPVFGATVHVHDGIVVDDSALKGQFRATTGGWADASDYLQYVATSANATYVMLAAYRDHSRAFADVFRGDGLPGANHTADILDEARHGIEWLLRMFPSDSEMYNQIADDRDHTFLDLPTTDSSDYGWGKGGARPVYPCTGKPQGLFAYKNRSTGKASTAGKFASAFALAATLYRKRDPAFSRRLRARAIAAYNIGLASPGVCQTAPGHSPYFYEEANWTDDMELAAAELYSLTHDARYMKQATEFASKEPVTPWMGADTARHYEWFPWHNNGHYAIWLHADKPVRYQMASYYKRGLELVARRAQNGFRVGIPFIWCSNDLMVAFATQAHLYRGMTGDSSFEEYETAARDWLFGTNPWGISMVIGLPHSGDFARDPHSVVSRQLHLELTGGLVDGPVYRSIFQNLKAIELTHADRFAAFNTGFIVYHDDWGDYSTNEPIMDGTASLTYLLGALSDDGRTRH
jgi:endoglucanase